MGPSLFRTGSFLAKSTPYDARGSSLTVCSCRCPGMHHVVHEYVPADISQSMSFPYGANPDRLFSTCRLETVSASSTACFTRRFHIPDIPQICSGSERLVEGHHTMIRLLDRRKRGSSILQDCMSNHGLHTQAHDALYARKGRDRFQRNSRFRQDTAPKDEIYPESRLFWTSASDEFQEFSYLRTKLIHPLYGEDGVTGYDSCIAVRYTGPLAHRVDSLFIHPSFLRQVKPSSVVGGPERESSDQL